MVEEKILTRIRNMLIKSENEGASEAEAEACLLRAQRMMAEHGLSMDDVGLGKQKKKEAMDKNADPQIMRKVWWKGPLAMTIGENFRCMSYFFNYGRQGMMLRFVGLPDDVELAVELYRYAVNVIEHNSKQYLKKRKKEIEKANNINFKKMSIEQVEDYASFEINRPFSAFEIASIKKKYPEPMTYKMRLIMAIKDKLGISINPSALKNDYIAGFLDGLRTKFKEQVDQNNWGLILRTDEVVKEAMEALNLRSSSKSSAKTLGDSEARQDGFQAGRAFSTPAGDLKEGQRQIGK